jgi:hypothetical protein
MKLWQLQVLDAEIPVSPPSFIVLLAEKQGFPA